MRDHYLDLLARCLTGMVWEDPPIDPWNGILRDANGTIVKPENIGAGIYRVEPGAYNADVRARGQDWPKTAATMVGLQRLLSLRGQIETIEREGIPGDVLEAGAWRGGASIFMRAVLKSLGSPRTVFVADSFAGLPKPEAAEDAGDQHHNFGPLAASLEEVRANFARFDLLDDQVVFLRGWFKDTLPQGPWDRLALIRLDGDMYGSTMDVLTACYSYLSIGGFCVIDDFNLPAVQLAVRDFRRSRNLHINPQPIDRNGIYWCKEE